MHPKRRQRLLIVLGIVLLSSAAVGLVSYALRGNINLFYPPAEVASAMHPSTERFVWVGWLFLVAFNGPREI